MDITANAPARWYLLSLRPRGGHAALRAASARHGGGLLALSPWRLAPLAGETAVAGLRQALAAPATIFTSPAAVAAAATLAPDLRQRLHQAIAVGAGTARALHRQGVTNVAWPVRMDSEGVLGLAALRAAPVVGLVTAPGGRGLLAAQLQADGRRLLRADVYQRQPVALPAQSLQRLQAHLPASVLALSSGEALQALLAQLPGPLLAALQRQPVVAASARLAELARTAGFADVHRAEGPMPAQLACAAAALMTQHRPG